MTGSDHENPFDLLPLGAQIKRENFLVGFLPWVLLCVLEGELIYLWVISGSPGAFLLLIVFELFLLPPVLGYAAQLHSLRSYENLWRRIRYEDAAVTLITASDVLRWVRGNTARVARKGFLANGVFWLVLFAYFGFLEMTDPNFDGRLLLFLLFALLIRSLPLPAMREYATAVGFEKLFTTRGYFRSRLRALSVLVLSWLVFVFLATICTILVVIVVLQGLLDVSFPGSVQISTFVFLLCLGVFPFLFSNVIRIRTKRILRPTIRAMRRARYE